MAIATSDGRMEDIACRICGTVTTCHAETPLYYCPDCALVLILAVNGRDVLDWAEPEKAAVVLRRINETA